MINECLILPVFGLSQKCRLPGAMLKSNRAMVRSAWAPRRVEGERYCEQRWENHHVYLQQEHRTSVACLTTAGPACLVQTWHFPSFCDLVLLSACASTLGTMCNMTQGSYRYGFGIAFWSANLLPSSQTRAVYVFPFATLSGRYYISTKHRPSVLSGNL
ncbi:hypothetical protein DFH94DRAFT_392240 [Russula ochroleuca]|jgi:hypothetical protein|uniref:Uncharacterized protein n=1 Tax=Russula ochroleuca TaxID=152965 RepID=A0A9P5JUH2_9AGAM|nr:hypothetical protein DFH94DRAFT_392240 [Russula ochroleuca]